MPPLYTSETGNPRGQVESQSSPAAPPKDTKQGPNYNSGLGQAKRLFWKADCSPAGWAGSPRTDCKAGPANESPRTSCEANGNFLGETISNSDRFILRKTRNGLKFKKIYEGNRREFGSSGQAAAETSALGSDTRFTKALCV